MGKRMNKIYQIYKRLSDGEEVRLRSAKSGHYTEDDKYLPKSVVKRFYKWQRASNSKRGKTSVHHRTTINGFRVRLSKTEMEELGL